MAAFRIYKINDGGTINQSNAVYFENIGGAFTAWFQQKVTASAGSIAKLAIPIPTVQTNVNDGGGIYFPNLTTGWPDGGLGQILMGTTLGTGTFAYTGGATTARSVIVGSGFEMTYNGSVGAWVLSVPAGSEGLTSLIAQTNETNNLLQVAATAAGTGGTFADAATVNASNSYLDIRLAPNTSRNAVLGARNTASANAVPTYRKIQAGSVKNTINTSEGGDIEFEGYTFTEDYSNYIKIIATRGNASGVASWGKSYFLDAGYFAASTVTPGGGSTADIITLNLNNLKWTATAELSGGNGASTDITALDTLSILPGLNNAVLTTTMYDANTTTPDIRIEAIDAGANKLVIWDDNSGGAGQLNYIGLGTGFSISGSLGSRVLNLTAVGTFNDFSIQAEGGTAVVIDDGEIINFVTGASATSIFSFVAASATPNTITLNADAPSVAGDRIVFWDNSAGALQYLSVGTGLDLTGTTLTATAVSALNGAFNVSIGIAAASGTALSWGTSTGFTANASAASTYDLRVGPALTNLATFMNNATAGFIKRTGVNTYTIDSTSYLTTWSFNIDANSGGSQAVTDGLTILFAGGTFINSVRTANTITHNLLYNTNDFEVGAGGVLQLKDKFVSDWKQSVRVATTANVSGTYTATGGVSGRGRFTNMPNNIDGVALTVGNRILVRAQSTGAQNGIWVVHTVGSGANGEWDRAIDFDSDSEVTSGATISVEEGNTWLDTVFQLITNDPITIGGASGTTLVWSPIAKTAFFGVGNGILLDPSSNQVTFATTDVGTTQVTANTALNGIMFRANTIEAAIDGTYLDYNSNAISFKSIAAKSIYANATNAGARPIVLSATAANVVLKSSSANDKLEWGLLTTSNLTSDAGVKLTQLENINAYTWLGNPTNVSAKPAATVLPINSIVYRPNSGNITSLTYLADSVFAQVGNLGTATAVQIDSSYEFLGHDATSLGAKTFANGPNGTFEWVDSTLYTAWAATPDW
jgi:hypothetical protein